MKAPQPEVVVSSRSNPGETLRKARESKNLAQADVAQQLNLTLRALTQVEAGAFDKLPGHTFARGYIRAYAKFLELDRSIPAPRRRPSRRNGRPARPALGRCPPRYTYRWSIWLDQLSR